MSANVENRGSLVAEVCRRLTSDLRENLHEGERWLPPERELATQLGVSRTVVREATKRLELQGLLEVRHGVGIKVVDRMHAPFNGSVELSVPDEADRLRQLVEVRLIVEPEVAARAATRRTAAALRAILDAQERLEAANETNAAAEADLEFHQALARAAGNRILELVLESMADLGRASRLATINAVGKTVARDHHAAILDAVRLRRPDEARDAMRRHIASAGDHLKKHFLQPARKG